MERIILHKNANDTDRDPNVRQYLRLFSENSSREYLN